MSADLQRIIRIVFQGDNQSQRAFNELTGSLNAIEGGVRSVTGPMADLADNILKAQAAAITLATGGLALMVQQAGSWSDSFNEISTLLDLTGDGLLEFRSNVLEYAATSAASLDDINGALYAAISAGVDYADSLDLLSTAERMATAAKADLEDSTVLLASVMNAYGAETSEAARYSDVFFQTVKLGQTTLPELAQSLSSVTSIAAAAGIPIETVAAAIATLTAKGMPTTEAMTAIRGAIAAIISPTKQAADYAEELGIEFGASALASRGLENVLLDVYTATGGNVEQMAKLFGNVRGLTGVLAAFGQDGGDAFRSTLEQMRDSTGATDEAYAKMADNVGQHTQTLINQMRVTLIQGGLPLLEQFGDAAGALGEIFEGMRIGLDQGAFDPLYDAFDALVTRMVQFGRDVAEALPDALDGVDWTPLLDGLRDLDDALGGLFRALFQDLDPSKPEELRQIIQTLVNLMGQLSTSSAAVLDQWRPLAAMAGNLAQGVGEANPLLTTMAGELLGAAQKAEFLWEKLGFLKGTFVLVSAEATATGENITWLGIAFNAIINPVQAVHQLLQTLFPSLRQSGEEMSGAAVGADELGRKTSWLETIIKNLPGPLGTIVRSFSDIGTEAHAATSETGGLGAALDAVPDETTTTLGVEGSSEFRDQVDWSLAKLGEIPDEKSVQVGAEVDRNSLTEAERVVDESLADYHTLTIEVDGETHEFRYKVADAKQEAEEPVEIDVALQFGELDTRQFEAAMDTLGTVAGGYFETIQSQVEWEAKLQIAEVEANARKVEAIMNSVAVSVQGAAEVLQSIFGNMGALKDAGFSKYEIERWIDAQISIQERGLALQERMAESEMRYKEARVAALSSGDSLITIDGQGLQPHLESFMWEILSAIQTRVNEEGLAMLTGV